MDADTAEGLGLSRWAAEERRSVTLVGGFGRVMCMEDAIRNAERILQKIDERWPIESVMSGRG